MAMSTVVQSQSQSQSHTNFAAAAVPVPVPVPSTSTGSSFTRAQLHRRPTDAVRNINASAGFSRPGLGVMPLSTRPRGHSFTTQQTHKYRGSGSGHMVELGALREEDQRQQQQLLVRPEAGSSLKSQTQVQAQARGVSAVVVKSRERPSPQVALPLEDNYVFVSTANTDSSEDVTALAARESSEKSKYLSFRIPSFQSPSQSQSTESSVSDDSTTPTPTLTPTQSSHRLSTDPSPSGSITPTAAKMEQPPPQQQGQLSAPNNKYATFSGGRFSSLSRRRGKLSDIVYPDPSDAAVVPLAQKQLASPPMRLPGASLPPITTSNVNSNNSSPGRRRSSSQPPLPGTIASSTGPSSSSSSSLHIRQSLNPSSLSMVSTLSQLSSSSAASHRSSITLVSPSYPPQITILRPYRLMTLLRTTMTSKSGGHVTRRLHVPNEVWFQTGVKLANLPEKIRVVETLCANLEEIHSTSPKAIQNKDTTDGNNKNSLVSADNSKDIKRWILKLDEWNTTCDGILLNFGRKLGVREGAAKKNGADKVPFWVRGTNVDSMSIYVSGLVKLFHLAQILGEHTNTLLQVQIPPPYDSTPLELRQALESRLKRSSEFFSSVVLTFVTRDLYLLLDKYVKSKMEKWLAD